MGCLMGNNKKINKVDKDPKKPAENNANVPKIPIFF